MSRIAIVGCLFFLPLSIAIADPPSPYVDHQHRDIKALSPQEAQDYLQGKGMGYAKAAELNHYPGPAHALELADQLGLSAEQRNAATTLMNAHRSQAKVIGLKRVESERAIEGLFRSSNTDQGQLAAAVRHAGMLESEYRLSHLETHRRMRALLTEEQVARYDQLRGYAAKH